MSMFFLLYNSILLIMWMIVIMNIENINKIKSTTRSILELIIIEKKLIVNDLSKVESPISGIGNIVQHCLYIRFNENKMLYFI